jgi:transcription elongation factor GreB
VSKAFTKEDDTSETQALPRLRTPLKPGERNFMTQAGAQRLRQELEQLSDELRSPLLASARAGGDARHELQSLNKRIAYLQESLRTAVIAPQDASPGDRVQFGATVAVRSGAGESTQYRLVGVDETDHERNWVSWQSPIARALLNRRLGEVVTFKSPAGQVQLEITDIGYA